MDRSEPALIPEWLKSSGSATSGGYGNHQSVSCLQSDNHPVSKHSRNKSSFINSEHDGGRSFVSEKTTSTYFRRSTSGKDSSHSRSYSFNRSHRDREWEDLPEYRDKDKPTLGDHRLPYSDHIGGVLPGKFSKETLRRSQSMVSRKLEGTLRKKVGGDSADASNSSNHINSSSLLLASSSVPSSMQTSFGRDFPSLGADLKQISSELRRVPSPILPSSVHSLPSAGPNATGPDGWTSSLAEVPGVIASNSTASLPSQQAVSGSSGPLAQRVGGLNMAEAVAQGPSRARTPPQVSVDTQRLEELAIKQSRQLIPVIPSTPKPVLGPSDKSKSKAGPQQSQFLASHGNQSLRGGPARLDSGKTSANLGKLQVLKPAREVNSVSSTVVKENMSPRNGVKVVNTLSLNPTAAATSAPLRAPANIQNPSGPERKSAATSANLEKKPSSLQSQSRIDFFNLLKKKKPSSGSNASAGDEAVPSVMKKSPDSVVEDSAAAATSGANFATSESKLDYSSGLQIENGGNVMANGEGGEGIPCFVENGEDESDVDVPDPDEEEAAFLRSMGWDENAAGDEGLTQDEIRAFLEARSVQLMGMKSRSELIGLLLKVNNNNGSCVGSSTGLSLSKS